MEGIPPLLIILIIHFELLFKPTVLPRTRIKRILLKTLTFKLDIENKRHADGSIF